MQQQQRSVLEGDMKLSISLGSRTDRTKIYIGIRFKLRLEKAFYQDLPKQIGRFHIIV